MQPSVITLEFNELSPKLMNDFIEQSHLPNFERLRRQSYVYVTDAEEQSPNLEPWIQWVTVHTGLSFSQHGIFDLGDGHKLTAPCLWDMISRAGYRVWVCGSMNAGAHEGINGFILPDPWSTGLHPYPKGEFEPYYNFVQRYVQEYTRDSVPLNKMAHISFIRFMAAKGLTSQTVVQIGKQLIRERGGRNRWRRATILDRFQWDVFRRYWRKYRPNYSTFFSNSTAHFQHLYWRDMDPGPFHLKPSAEELDEYRDAILFGYQQMDRIVGECLELAGQETTIILCTALSQQPCLVYEQLGGKKFYRVVEAKKLLAFTGISKHFEYSPVMSEQFHLYFQTEQDAAEACSKLKSLRVDGREALGLRQNGKEILAGCCIFDQLSADALLHSAETGQTEGFLEHFYLVDGMKSGMHHPDGIFWLRTPAKCHQACEEKISLRQVAPTLLSLFGLSKPESMSMDAVKEIVP